MSHQNRNWHGAEDKQYGFLDQRRFLSPTEQEKEAERERRKKLHSDNLSTPALRYYRFIDRNTNTPHVAWSTQNGSRCGLLPNTWVAIYEGDPSMRSLPLIVGALKLPVPVTVPASNE